MRSEHLLAGSLLLTAMACGGQGKPESPPANAPAAAAPTAPLAAPATDTVAPQAVVPTPADEPASTSAASANQGQYAVCSTCHQPTGLGLPPAFPPLAGSEVLNGTPEIPIAIVLHGLQGPLKVKGVEFNGVMAAWATFSDEDIAATLTYERSSWGNSASAITAAQVAAVRKATGGRATPWTWEELKKAKLK